MLNLKPLLDVPTKLVSFLIGMDRTWSVEVKKREARKLEYAQK